MAMNATDYHKGGKLRFIFSEILKFPNINPFQNFLLYSMVVFYEIKTHDSESRGQEETATTE